MQRQIAKIGKRMELAWTWDLRPHKAQTRFPSKTGLAESMFDERINALMRKLSFSQSRRGLNQHVEYPGNRSADLGRQTGNYDWPNRMLSHIDVIPDEHLSFKRMAKGNQPLSPPNQA